MARASSRPGAIVLLVLAAFLVILLAIHIPPPAPRTPVHRAAWKGIVWGYIPQMWCPRGLRRCNWQGIEQDAEAMQGAGITWARLGLRQNLPFWFYDRLLAIARAHGVRVLLTVYKSDPAKDLGSARQQMAYRQWLRAAVTRYAGMVRDWEIGNEENLGGSWHIKNHAPDARYLRGVRSYLSLLEQSHRIIKAVDPRLQVVIGGISESAMARYVRALERLHAARWFDIFAFHPYASDPSGVVARLDDLRRITELQPGGLGSKPVWITEVGFYCEPNWRTTGLACPETLKARYLDQTMLGLRGAGIHLPIMWYVLHEAGDYNGYGLVRVDPGTARVTLNPAWDAYRSL